MYNLGGFYAVVILYLRQVIFMLETGSSSGRKDERDITDFELMKCMRWRELMEDPTKT